MQWLLHTANVGDVELLRLGFNFHNNFAVNRLPIIEKLPTQLILAHFFGRWFPLDFLIFIVTYGDLTFHLLLAFILFIEQMNTGILRVLLSLLLIKIAIFNLNRCLNWIRNHRFVLFWNNKRQIRNILVYLLHIIFLQSFFGTFRLQPSFTVTFYLPFSILFPLSLPILLQFFSARFLGLFHNFQTAIEDAGRL